MVYPIIDNLIGNKINNDIHEGYYEFIFFGKKIKIFNSIYSSLHVYINFIIIMLCIIKINYLYAERIKKIDNKYNEKNK
jgi:hypothetical protein